MTLVTVALGVETVVNEPVQDCRTAPVLTVETEALVPALYCHVVESLANAVGLGCTDSPADRIGSGSVDSRWWRLEPARRLPHSCSCSPDIAPALRLRLFIKASRWPEYFAASAPD